MRFRSLPERLVEPGILNRGSAESRATAVSKARRARIASFFALALALSSAPSQVAVAGDSPVAGLAPHARLENIDLVLNGAGLRNFLFFDIYVAALYLPRKLSDAHEVLKSDLPRRLRITLLRDMDADRDLQRLLGGMRDNNTPEELAAIHEQVQHFLQLLRAMGTIEKGSVVRLDYLPESGTHVWLNHRLLGTVPGADFNRCVLKIWLGDRPIQESLKKALLGEAREAI